MLRRSIPRYQASILMLFLILSHPKISCITKNAPVVGIELEPYQFVLTCFCHSILKFDEEFYRIMRPDILVLHIFVTHMHPNKFLTQIQIHLQHKCFITTNKLYDISTIHTERQKQTHAQRHTNSNIHKSTQTHL